MKKILTLALAALAVGLATSANSQVKDCSVLGKDVIVTYQGQEMTAEEALAACAADVGTNIEIVCDCTITPQGDVIIHFGPAPKKQ
jgi:hypothetical protein